jgi:hypothetical protein
MCARLSKPFWFILGINTYLPFVLYDIYFLSHQFHFLSNLLLVEYEKAEMVPPSDFPSKTNVHPRHFLSCCCLDVVGNEV